MVDGGEAFFLPFPLVGEVWKPSGALLKEAARTLTVGTFLVPRSFMTNSRVSSQVARASRTVVRAS